jgi:hypothetical protein
VRWCQCHQRQQRRELGDQRRQIIQKRRRDLRGRLGEPRNARGAGRIPKLLSLKAEDVFELAGIISHGARP